MLEGIILAAGLGKRLRPYTEHTPKPLLPVQGKAILAWIIQALPPQVSSICVVVNYLAEQIEEWLAKQHDIPPHQVVRQKEPRGSGDALLACKEFIRGGRVLVLNGDDLYAACDLQELARRDFGVLGYPVEEPRAFGILRVTSDGMLAELVEKPDWPGPQLANIGAYTLPRTIFDVEPSLSPRGEYELTEMVNNLAQQLPCQVIPARFWHPIGTIEAWQAAQKLDLSKWIPERGH